MARLDTSARKAFYRKGLDEHRQLLRTAVNEMAHGELVHALTIANSIRTLVHETGSSKPVLKHLRTDFLSLPIYSAKEQPGDPRYAHLQKVTVLKVAANIQLADGRMSLRPEMDMQNCVESTLGHWWTDLSLIVPGGVALSRKDIILGIANKEGAHVDDDMAKPYRIMLESKSLRIRINDGEYEPVNISRYVCGTAGVELLDCLDRNFPIEETS